MSTEFNFNYEGVIEEYNRQVISKRKKIAKVLNVLLIIYLVIMTLVYLLFPDVLDSSDSTTTYYVIGGVVGIPLLLGSLLNQLITSEKPFYNYVIREIVKNINNNQTYEYLAYPRNKENINKIGGLFSRSATINIKNQIKGKTKTNNDFNYFNMRLYTTDGKNHYILFSGMYFIIKYPIGKVFQIRSHSKPKLKDTRFIKNDEVNGLKLFTVKDDPTSTIDQNFIDTLTDIKNDYNAKKIYLSVVNDEIHLAIESPETIRKPRVLNNKTLAETANKINKIINIPNEVVDKIQ